MTAWISTRTMTSKKKHTLGAVKDIDARETFGSSKPFQGSFISASILFGSAASAPCPSAEAHFEVICPYFRVISADFFAFAHFSFPHCAQERRRGGDISLRKRIGVFLQQGHFAHTRCEMDGWVIWMDGMGRNDGRSKAKEDRNRVEGEMG